MDRGAEVDMAVEVAASTVVEEAVFMGALDSVVADSVVAQEILATSVHAAAFLSEGSEMRRLRMDSALERHQRAD